MNPELSRWLETARKNLSPRAKEIVREQILEHFLSATERYQLEGKTRLEAEALALADLGDSEVASKKFEKAYLTNKELQNLVRYKKRASDGFNLVIAGICIAVVGFFLIDSYLEDRTLSSFMVASLVLLMLISLNNGVRYFFAIRLNVRQFVKAEWAIQCGHMLGLIGYLWLLKNSSVNFDTNNWLWVVVFVSCLAALWQGITRFSSWRKLSSL